MHRLEGPSFTNAFLTREVATGRIYAIKTFSLQEGVGIAGLNEIDILRRFRHPNLLHAKEILWVDESNIGLVLSLGKWTLRNAINQSILSTDQVVRIMWDLASAITFLHHEKVLHLDLRCSNIILRGSQDKIRPIIASFNCTRHGTLVESNLLYPKINYCPPEILTTYFTGESFIYSPKTDIWALGLIYLELLSGETIFEENIDLDSFVKWLQLLQDSNARFNFLKQVLPLEYYDALDLLFRMLDPDPETRLETENLLTTGFFVTRNRLPIQLGKVKACVFQKISSCYQEIPSFDEVRVELPELTVISWQRGVNLCLALNPTLFKVSRNSLFWLTLFISHKLYDDRCTSKFFISQSQLDPDTFLDLEAEIILSLGGCIGCR